MSGTAGTKRRVGRSDGRPERGATLIEFAVIAPVLLALLFGIIDFGFVFNDYIQVRQGSREATRQAVSARLGDDTSCTIASPAPTNTAVRRLVCLAKDRVDLPESDVRIRINVEEPYSDRKSVQVCVMAQMQSVTRFYSVLLDSKVVQSAVQMRIEQTTDDLAGTNVEDLVDYTESPLSGQSFTCALSTTT